MNIFGRILDRVNRAVEYAVTAMLIVMVIVVFLQVIFRFIVKSAIPWSEELARYLLVWISFLGASIGVKRKGHIGIAAVVNVLPGRVKIIVSLIANALSMGFFVIIVIWGHKILGVVASQLSPAMEISMALPYAAILTGGILMLIYSSYHFMTIIKGSGEEI